MPRSPTYRVVRLTIIVFVLVVVVYKLASPANINALSQAGGYYGSSPVVVSKIEDKNTEDKGADVKKTEESKKEEKTEVKQESKPEEKAEAKSEEKKEEAETKPEENKEEAKVETEQNPEESKEENTTPAPPPFNDGVGPTYQHANATFVTLARNEDIWSLVKSIRNVEDRFNHKYHYDWVFLNDDDFDEDFKEITTSLVSGTTKYGKIPKEHWGFPEWIDKEKAAKTRQEMAEKKIIYGDSVSYRHMCRFESGFFYRQPLLLDYKYYWRVEPDIILHCDIDYDVFKFMEEKEYDYGFTLSLYEYGETIATLWDSVRKFIKAHPDYLAKDNLMDWLSDDEGYSYNRCHFWSNFEIGNLDFWRGKEYSEFFDFLDQEGGFFYERWGDAPVHSIGAGLFLPKAKVHYFDDIGYWHVPFSNCPTNREDRTRLKCSCNPRENFAWKGYSCTPKFYNVMGMERPSEWRTQS
ncbi:alpha-1,2 mannosyltransferase KTR1 [Myxozyma melibiosi]|uniref:Alpha-1,2 mannosyltransferase KTR1 n=1 Tax=Myxozyma melibiosi TaxID=54550 RepID=A0ABR1FD76_9ASCO